MYCSSDLLLRVVTTVVVPRFGILRQIFSDVEYPCESGDGCDNDRVLRRQFGLLFDKVQHHFADLVDSKVERGELLVQGRHPQGLRGSSILDLFGAHLREQTRRNSSFPEALESDLRSYVFRNKSVLASRILPVLKNVTTEGLEVDDATQRLATKWAYSLLSMPDFHNFGTFLAEVAPPLVGGSLVNKGLDISSMWDAFAVSAVEGQMHTAFVKIFQDATHSSTGMNISIFEASLSVRLFSLHMCPTNTQRTEILMRHMSTKSSRTYYA